MTQSPESPGLALPAENAPHGTLYALVALPVGVLLWTLVWSIGFVSSVIAFGFALGSLALYRAGSGGRIGRYGAGLVTAITALGIGTSFVLGAILYADLTAAADPVGLWVTLVLAVIFGALGCFIAWRTAIVQAHEQEPVVRKPLPGFEHGPGEDRW